MTPTRSRSSGTIRCDSPWGRAQNTRSRPSQGLRVGRLVDQTGVGGGQRRRVLPDHLAGVGVGRHHGHLDVGMAGQERRSSAPVYPEPR